MYIHVLLMTCFSETQTLLVSDFAIAGVTEAAPVAAPRRHAFSAKASSAAVGVRHRRVKVAPRALGCL